VNPSSLESESGSHQSTLNIANESQNKHRTQPVVSKSQNQTTDGLLKFEDDDAFNISATSGLPIPFVVIILSVTYCLYFPAKNPSLLDDNNDDLLGMANPIDTHSNNNKVSSLLFRIYAFMTARSRCRTALFFCRPLRP